MMGIEMASESCWKKLLMPAGATRIVAPWYGGITITIAAPWSCARRLRSAQTFVLKCVVVTMTGTRPRTCFRISVVSTSRSSSESRNCSEKFARILTPCEPASIMKSTQRRWPSRSRHPWSSKIVGTTGKTPRYLLWLAEAVIKLRSVGCASGFVLRAHNFDDRGHVALSISRGLGALEELVRARRCCQRGLCLCGGLLRVSHVLLHQPKHEVHLIGPGSHPFRHRFEDAAPGRACLQEIQGQRAIQRATLNPDEGFGEGRDLHTAKKVVDQFELRSTAYGPYMQNGFAHRLQHRPHGVECCLIGPRKKRQLSRVCLRTAAGHRRIDQPQPTGFRRLVQLLHPLRTHRATLDDDSTWLHRRQRTMCAEPGFARRSVVRQHRDNHRRSRSSQRWSIRNLSTGFGNLFRPFSGAVIDGERKSGL